MDTINNYPLIKTTALLNDIIYRAIIMLGSNKSNAEYYINSAINSIAALGTITLLNRHISTDHTGKTNNCYLNTAIILTLTTPMPFNLLLSYLKDIEKAHGRIQKSSVVTLDLDIMAVYLETWYAIEERLPLKVHEQICLGVI